MQHLAHLRRERKIVEDKSLLNFTSNDYLCLANHLEVKKAFIKGVEKYGLGSGSSPQVSGYSAAHQELEEAFAAFLGRKKAMLFNSGYHANLGVITSLADRASTIFSDKLCHASLIDGVLLSRAKHVRFRHCDYTQVNALLECNSNLKLPAGESVFLFPDGTAPAIDRHIPVPDGLETKNRIPLPVFATVVKKHFLIVSESVFSMEGDVADIRELSAIAKQHHILLIVDDAHGVGVLGENGRGIIEHTGINADIDCLITPLGKAPGSMGAIVSGSEELIDAILQSARTYRYSTAIPAANCVGTLAALKIMQSENWRREKLLSLSEFFICEAEKRGLILSSKALTPIKSILIGSNEKVMTLQKELLNIGIFIAAIRPPTVPKNTARIRISLNCEHEESNIIKLLDGIYACL